MTGRRPSVSAVLPAYNEAGIIATTVRRTHAALAGSQLPDFEVIVVDDGSRDATAAQVQAVADELGRIRLVRHAENRGYGGALRSGFEAARCEATWLMDSDGQFDPQDLARLLPGYAPDTLVLGWRERRSDPFVRRFNHAAFFALVRLRWGSVARDVNCGFKLFPAQVGRGLHAEGAMISTELLLRARRSGYRVVEVPVAHYPRRVGTPTGANPRVVLRAFQELWAMSSHRESLAGLAPPQRV